MNKLWIFVFVCRSVWPCVKLATCWGCTLPLWPWVLEEAGEMERRECWWSRWSALVTPEGNSEIVKMKDYGITIRYGTLFRQTTNSIYPFSVSTLSCIEGCKSSTSYPSFLGVKLGCNLNQSLVGHHTETNNNLHSHGHQQTGGTEETMGGNKWLTSQVLRSAKSRTCVSLTEQV